MKYFTLALAAPAIAQELVALSSDDDGLTNRAQSLQSQLHMLTVMHDTSVTGPAKYGEQDKALTQADMGLLSNYGCWCFFETAHGKGRGKPVDEIDMFCKTLHDGYECIMADAAEAAIDCVPWEATYNSAFGSGIPTGLTMTGLAAECDLQNAPDSCESWTCKVEGWFVQQYFLYSTSGGVIDAAIRHDNGFNMDVGCPIQTGISSEKSCCGEYPERYPYKTYGGARDCCQTHTFNTNMYQCCPDGHVRMTC